MDVNVQTKSIDVIQALCFAISVAITVAGIFHIYEVTNGIFRVHVAIAAVFASSGLFISKKSIAKSLYFIAGSLTWYGVFYSFISSESHLMPHHYLQPEILIAFLSFAGSILTLPDIEDVKMMLLHPVYNSSGLVCLLVYFWIVELYFVEQSHDFFVDSVMNKMPLRLADFTLFSDHRISYSVALILSHYCYISFLYVVTFYSPAPENQSEKIGMNSNGAINQELVNKMKLKIDHLKGRLSSTRTGINIPPISDKLNHVPKNNQNVTHTESELPEDCLEISYEDAILLSGGDMDVDHDVDLDVANSDFSATANNYTDQIRQRKLHQGGV